MRILFRLLLLLFPFVSFGQELPPFLNFEPSQYEAGNQNWMMAQGDNNNIYIANSRGLLEYTGSQWNLYPMPNETIVRSVETVGNQIFTGAYMDFGVWKKTTTGNLEYSSFLPRLEGGLRDGEQIWHIKSIPGFVVFQSFSSLYIYDLAADEIHRANTAQGDFISNLYKVGNRIFYQVGVKGLYELQHEESKLVIPPEIIGNLTIVHLYQRNGELRVISENSGFYRWTGSELLPYMQEVGLQLEAATIFSALDLPSQGLILGTIDQGLYQISEAGEIQHFHQENGLLNNTVLSLLVDDAQNLWAGMDQGLGVIHLHSPVSLFEDRNGQLGSVYSSFQTEEFLYVGTNQGLYVRQNGMKGFQLIKGTNGQVWSLMLIDGALLCGHNSGTFLVEGTEARKISERSGTWLVKNLQGQDSLYVQGHYNGLSFLKKQDGKWFDLPLLPGFPHSARYIESAGDGMLWVGNEHKGVFRVKINKALNEIEDLRNYNFPKVSGITSSIFSFNDTLYYSTPDRLLQYHEVRDTFVSESALARVFEPMNRISGRVLPLGEELWGFENSSIFKVEKEQLKKGYVLKQVNLPKELRAIPWGNENISKLNDGSFFLGMANGYVRFREAAKIEGELELRIDKIQRSALDAAPELVDLTGGEPFHYKTNNLDFIFSISKSQIFPKPMYSYRLIGQSANWSPWSFDPVASFENLDFGNYEFQVKGKVGSTTTDVTSFSFEINRPWYVSWPAILVYVLIFSGFLYLINKINHKRHLKENFEREQALRMKNLEAEQEIIKLQNRQLEHDVEVKNKELAVSTMNLIRKNEFLSKIREELKTAEAGVEGAVMRTIENEISGEDNWEFFKEAFNNADKDFFKKIKSKHPELTSNDLKLCAYLRLNLSSKEIAPLLNISVKSVEIKRYRLRKKMQLSRDIQLTDYILSI